MAQAALIVAQSTNCHVIYFVVLKPFATEKVGLDDGKIVDAVGTGTVYLNMQLFKLKIGKDVQGTLRAPTGRQSIFSPVCSTERKHHEVWLLKMLD